jgi:hypothetical protein
MGVLKLTSVMTDPFRSEMRREWLRRLRGALLLTIWVAVIPGSLIWLSGGFIRNKPQRVNATVVRIGTYPVGVIGDRPILRVRLDDGSIRQVITSRANAQDCVRGMKVTLSQSGSRLTLGLHGCRQSK